MMSSTYLASPVNRRRSSTRRTGCPNTEPATEGKLTASTAGAGGGRRAARALGVQGSGARLYRHVDYDEEEDDQLDTGDGENAVHAACDVGFIRPPLGDELADASQLRAHEKRARQRRYDDGDEPDSDPEALVGPPTYGNEGEAGNQHDDRRRHVDALSDPCGITGEGRQKRGVLGPARPGAEKQQRQAPSDPGDGPQYVSGQKPFVHGVISFLARRTGDRTRTRNPH